MKMPHVWLAAACLSGLVSCSHQPSHVSGGTIELIPKSHFLASKGLRVLGDDVKPVNGRTEHTLKAEKLPLSGTDWPYILEIRIKDSETGQLVHLSPRQKSQTFVKMRVQDAEGSIHASTSLAEEWLRPDPGGYYYRKSSWVEGYRALYLSDENGIDLDLRISLADDLADRVTCSVSIRTGGAK